MSGVRVLLGIAVALVAGPGCTTIGFERGCPISPRCRPFQAGTTDYHQVLAALGPPPKLSRTATGFVFLYEHIVVNEKQIGISFEKLLGDIGIGERAAAATSDATASTEFNAASIIRLSYAWSDADIETLVTTFDHAGLLQRARYERTNPDLGTTIGVSLIVSTSRKLGIENYQIEPGAMTWGTRLIDSPPQTLSSQQSLSSGHAGVSRLPGNMRVGQDAGVLPPPTVTRREKRQQNR